MSLSSSNVITPDSTGWLSLSDSSRVPGCGDTGSVLFLLIVSARLPGLGLPPFLRKGISSFQKTTTKLLDSSVITVVIEQNDSDGGVHHIDCMLIEIILFMHDVLHLVDIATIVVDDKQGCKIIQRELTKPLCDRTGVSDEREFPKSIISRNLIATQVFS